MDYFSTPPGSPFSSKSGGGLWGEGSWKPSGNHFGIFLILAPFFDQIGPKRGLPGMIFIDSACFSEKNAANTIRIAFARPKGFGKIGIYAAKSTPRIPPQQGGEPQKRGVFTTPLKELIFADFLVEIRCETSTVPRFSSVLLLLHLPARLRTPENQPPESHHSKGESLKNAVFSQFQNSTEFPL